MIDLYGKNEQPSLEELSAYVQTPVFGQFCSKIKETYNCREKIEFSSCSCRRFTHRQRKAMDNDGL